MIAPTESPKESLFEKLRLMRECPLCAESYKENKVVLLEEAAGSHLVHITCHRCHNAILAMVITSAIGMSSVGIMTDLSVSDFKKASNRSPISDKTLLDFHQYLKKNHQFEQNILQK